MADIKLTIDDKEVVVPAGTTIMTAAEKVGVKVPHYCYHPGLKLAGNCRMCLVDVEKSPKPVASCVAPVAEGMVVKTQTTSIKEARKSVMEFLLINHPLDCPTCDQAGECRLQDYYMEYDEVPSRFSEKKVHKNKMVPLGSGVMLDQERCVACTRCIRFCQEIAKEDELCLANRGDHVTITTFPGKELSNPYAGNVVDVCPVGALTSKDFRYQKRVWFLKSTPSICTGCSRGCNITVQQEESVVYRQLPRFNPDVNQYWMCDEGRNGYHFVNERRVLRSLANQKEVSFEESVSKLSELIKKYQPHEIGVVAHAAETNEVLESLKNFATTVLGTKHLYFSRFDPPNPTSDDILRTADKNPNQAGVDQLGFKPLSEAADVKALIVLRGLNQNDSQLVAKLGARIIGLFLVNEDVLMSASDVVLPIPSFVEQTGHFTNIQGKVQKITQAFEPKGEARFVWEWLDDVAAKK